MYSLNGLSVRTSDTLMDDDSPSFEMNQLIFVFFTLLFLASICSLALYAIRRRRMAREATVLPTYHQVSPHHRRSASISNFNTGHRNESVFVYDEKMNLIHNSSNPPSGAVPEIHITFPDEDDKSGGSQKGRVVVVHITDSGSVGMEPLNRHNLPPYQQQDANRFQSLDLERIGGLREKERPNRNWS
ncbi:hypothetical protein LTR84_000476 [Exophiala bonariae]|uniref:Uncharacterized protein n=1 Tax=Exophiala bonariae TaxID=1690606 RepID=A0AAV9NU61_9EURO|nr:hypothetical protein LTR84_000476 [Exophiala bonariae]